MASDHRARVLDTRVPADLEALDALRNDPGVDVLDHQDAQRDELRSIVPAVDGEVLDEPGRWVHYPWRRAVVGIVGPESFSLLRSDRNRNKITRSEQARLSRQRIGVIGLSVGHAIAHTIALEGLCGELRLADFDTIELSNLNRIPATVFDLGVNKAVVAARRIAELNPYLDVSIFTEGLTTESMDHFLDGLTVVVEECDSLDMKLMVREAARARRIPVVMETSDRGLLDVERFDLEPDRPVFHGLLGQLSASDLAGLPVHEKVPHVLRILDPHQLSARMAASMAEIDYTVSTWPQLGGDIMLGAASVAAALRRIGRGDDLASGRVRVDLEATLDSIAPPDAPAATTGAPPAVLEVDLSVAPGSTAADPDLQRAVATAASLAPSGGNTQPWAFTVDDTGFSVRIAPERTSTMDVRFRGSYVAAGAALWNARVAAAHFGVLGPTVLVPDGGNPHLAGRLTFGTGSDRDLADLYEAMLARRTNRRPGEVRSLDPSWDDAARGAAEAEGGHLHLVTDRTLVGEVGTLLAEADRLRYLSPVLHREMMSELAWPGRDSLELGLDVRTLELDGSDMAKLAVAERSDVMAYLAAWGAGEALGEITRDRVATSSAIAVVSVRGSDPAAYVSGGQALERFWATAQARGLSLQPVSPAFLYALDADDYATLGPPDTGKRLAALSGSFRGLVGVDDDEQLILVLRVSHAEPPTARSRRLPVSALMTAAHASEP